MNAEAIFDRLWNDYSKQNPSAEKIHKLFSFEGEIVENDHIAFRTLNDPKINIEVMSQIFTNAGYVEKGQYVFEEKRLKAKHFELPSNPDAPRIFISELIVEDFSPFLQKTMKELLESIPENVFCGEKILFAGNVWGKPSYEIYQKLRDESEYAAWFYIYGFRVNHFTVNVNALKKYDSVEKVNTFLKANGFTINSAGGEIKGTPKEMLEQSSIMADIIEVKCLEGTFMLPACYYEFAKRYLGEDGKLYSGFIAKSADKIFESTNFYQKK